jgi:hypothetical protein
LSLILLFALGMGPTLKAWRLTGKHRITEPAPNANVVKVG